VIDFQKRTDDTFGCMAVGAAVPCCGCNAPTLCTGDTLTAHRVLVLDDRSELFRRRRVIATLLQQNNGLRTHKLGFPIEFEQ